MERAAGVSGARSVETGRLLLAEVTAADVDDLYALSSDPRVWTHLPSGRHTERARAGRQGAVRDR